VEVDDLVVRFDGATVLDGIDLTVAHGEFVALLGSNGAGKTTLLRAMLGLTPATAGKIRLGGVALEAFSDWHSVALVPQRLPTAGAVPVSVEEVVAAGRIGRRPRLRPRAADKRAVTSALAAVDLLDRRRARLDTLSGGQQRRVLIARALATGARTLFLDEPTAGVDADAQHRLAEVLAGVADSGGTVLLVTHELGMLTPLVTRTVVLANGRVAFDGATPPPDFLHDHVHHHSHDDPHDRPAGPLMEG
jgi:zinc transport system ATP-binding protein